MRCNVLQQISDNVEEPLAVLRISSLCHACYFGKGWGEPGAAFAAQLGSDSMIWRKEFAMLGRDRAMLLLLSRARGNRLLPLTKCKPSHEGSSSRLQTPKPSSSQDRETVAWSLNPDPAEGFFLSHGQPQTEYHTGSLRGRQTWFSSFFCNFLIVITPSLSIYSIWCSHPFLLASGGYVVPRCRSSLWQGQQVCCHKCLGSYFYRSHGMLSVIRNSR